MDLHEHYMRMAIRQATMGMDEGEVPAGCVIVHRASAEAPEAGAGGRASGRILGSAHNQVELLKDPTAHAEMIAITQAATAIGDWRLTDTILYVTKEPCAMCAGAIVLARIPTVVYGVPDPNRGGAASVFNILNHPQLNHRCDVRGGVLQDECRDLLQTFFKKRRGEASE
jgi:tRNA(adenine34) deaminase